MDANKTASHKVLQRGLREGFFSIFLLKIIFETGNLTPPQIGKNPYIMNLKLEG